MRRRSVLAVLGAAVGGLAGCNTAEEGASRPEETVTAAPVPTDEPTPERAPPADLSPLGVADADELDRRHRRTLSAGPHGYTREAAALLDGEPIRRFRVRFRAAPDVTAYHFVLEIVDTERYPGRPVYAYVERWDDGTLYQRSGREDTEYAVVEGPSFGPPTERYRVRQLFEAFASAAVVSTPGAFEVGATDLRRGYDLTPRLFAELETPHAGRLEAFVGETPMVVERYDLSLRSALSDRPVDVVESVDYERLDESPDPPPWIGTAENQTN